jgi:hypothetical protein
MLALAAQFASDLSHLDASPPRKTGALCWCPICARVNVACSFTRFQFRHGFQLRSATNSFTSGWLLEGSKVSLRDPPANMLWR